MQPKTLSTAQSNGEGLTARPGKPKSELKTAEVAAYFKVDPATIRNWRKDGTIPSAFVRRQGVHKLMWRIEVIGYLEEKFAKTLN